MSKRVKPDVRRWIDGSALYDRSTILRVIDEEIVLLDHPDYDTSAEVAVLRTLRARFEEVDDG